VGAGAALVPRPLRRALRRHRKRWRCSGGRHPRPQPHAGALPRLRMCLAAYRAIVDDEKIATASGAARRSPRSAGKHHRRGRQCRRRGGPPAPRSRLATSGFPSQRNDRARRPPPRSKGGAICVGRARSCRRISGCWPPIPRDRWRTSAEAGSVTVGGHQGCATSLLVSSAPLKRLALGRGRRRPQAIFFRGSRRGRVDALRRWLSRPEARAPLVAADDARSVEGELVRTPSPKVWR
jgi:hypothetical protein